MAHITHLHSPFYFYVVRRGRSPAIAFCLGTAKGKTCKGWEDKRQLSAPAKGGHLSHEGCSAHAAPVFLRAGQALSRLNTTTAEVLRHRGAAVARGDELSAQRWQYHPCDSCPGVGHSWFWPTES